jgi:protein required for attachment to host cells
MQIPEGLQHFSKPTLVVTADKFEAKIYLAGGDSIEELEGLAAPMERSSDNEATNYSPESEMKDTERFKHFVKSLAAHFAEISRKHEITQIHLVMPAEVEHALDQELANDVKSLVGRKIHKDLAHQGLVEILKALFE